MRQGPSDTWLFVAHIIAGRGTCARRRVGCVLVDEGGQVLSTGYNGVAPGAKHCTEEPCPGAGAASGTGLDRCESIHAEQNALISCPDFRKVHRIYVTCSPCVSCVKMLLRTPAEYIYFLEPYAHDAEAKRLWLRDRPYWIHHETDLTKSLVAFSRGPKLTAHAGMVGVTSEQSLANIVDDAAHHVTLFNALRRVG